MSKDRTTAAMAIFVAVAAFGIVCRPLLPVDETRYIAVAWEMRLSGDWLVPHLNWQIYSHKPPLLFWLINVAWSIFGVSEFPARLIGPSFGVAAVGVTSLIGRRIWPSEPWLGGHAALILACSAAFTAFAGLTMFDAMLTLSVVLGVYALTFASQSALAWVGLGAAMALGGFSKGPVVLVYLLPLALSAPFWWQVSFRRASLGTALALSVGLVLIGLWLVPAILTAGPDYRDAVLWQQHAGRMVDSFAHVRPWWFFLALLPLFLWPWFWSAGIWRTIGNEVDYRDPGLRLVAIWFGVPLLLFSLISGKQIHYLLPSFPAIALFLARQHGERTFSGKAAALFPAALGVGFIAVGSSALHIDRLGTLAEPSWLFSASGIALVVLALAMVKWRSVGAYLAGPALIVVFDCAFLFGAPGLAYDTAFVAIALAPHEDKGIAILDGDYAGEFTFAGRLTRPVTEIDGVAAATAWLSEVPGRALLARIDRSHPEGLPEETIAFRDGQYGVWVSRGDTSR